MTVFLVLLVIGLFSARPAIAAQGVVFQTSVAPHADEDLASECRYEMTLTDPSRTVRGIWVIFDRGRDMLRYYGDPDVQAFAQHHDLALLLPFHCGAKSYSAPGAKGDMNVDPTKGIGRALLAAITQLAQSSSHPELASAKLILLGFSGAGSLVGRLADYAPDRIVAVIPADAGHFEPLGLDTISLSPKASAIPQLILTGGADSVCGTQRPYGYFRKHFDQGAPWTFVVQNKTPHCCIINAKSLILLWLEAILKETQTPPAVAARINRGNGWFGFIRTEENETKDLWGGTNWSVSTATTERRPTPPRGMIPAGWLPSHRFAKQWVSFVRQPEHPITSLP